MNRIAIVLCLALAMFCSNSDAASQTETILKLKGKEAQFVDSAAFRPASKEYRIVKGPVIITVKLAEVDYCKPPEPKGFRNLKDVAALEAIAKQFSHLWWDTKAAEKLMPLHIKAGDNTKAIRLYKEMRHSFVRGIPLAFRRGYWEALYSTKQYALLDKALTDTVKGREREASSWAYIVRGDMLAGEGKTEEALIGGYLKTVAMFSDIQSSRKMALEKTIAALEASGDRRVARFQKMLKDEQGK